MPTRRHFLLNCTALALTVSAVSPLAFASPPSIRDVSLDEISQATFNACLKKTFQVSGSGISAELILVKAEEPVFKQAQSRSKDAKNEKFMLLFQGSPSVSMEQNTYSFEIAEIGRFSMFITPVKCKDQGHSYYEAIFNRALVNSSK